MKKKRKKEKKKERKKEIKNGNMKHPQKRYLKAV
jgi:hypothetical protein